MIRHPDFAARFAQACDGAGVPPRNFGRLRWIRQELARLYDQEVTEETVRKWLAGHTYPRPEKLKSLARLLAVDQAWLASGHVSGVAERPALFERVDTAPRQDRGRLILDRVRRRLGGSVKIMPGVDLTDPTGEVWDAERG